MKVLKKRRSLLHRLLGTVPNNILDSSEKIVKAVEESSKSQPSAPSGTSDQQLDQLVQLVPGA